MTICIMTVMKMMKNSDKNVVKEREMDKTLDWLYSDLDELIDFEYGESEGEKG